jgi:hypothetical protein
MKPTKSKYSILPQSNTHARVPIASWLWLGILHCLALVIWHQSTEPKALSNSISGPAWVRDIEPCQGVLPGDGQVITATFQHSSGDVIDLVWSDDESRNLESIGTTSNHPFYAFDRGDYVQAGSLQEGERLLTYSGDTKRVVSKLARPGPETVYNLEVFGEHVYFIGHDGVLVHNSDSYGLNAGVTSKPAHLYRKRLGDAYYEDYQRHATGRDYEHYFDAGAGRATGIDGIQGKYLVEAKWAGRNDAAFRNSVYNPATTRYVTLGKEAVILDQAERLLKLNASLGTNGVRYAISNETAANHFRTLLRTKFADQMDAGILKVFHVPGNGM